MLCSLALASFVGIHSIASTAEETVDERGGTTDGVVNAVAEVWGAEDGRELLISEECTGSNMMYH
jgi:hypothetical protein